MKWMLVYILIENYSVYVINAYTPQHTFGSMVECFEAREKLAVTVGGPRPGYFPKGKQGICIQVD